MNVLSFLRRSSKKIFLFCTVIAFSLSAAGCMFLTEPDKPQKKPQEDTVKSVPPGIVSANRIAARKQTGTFLCLIADSGSPFASFDPEKEYWQGIEPQIIRETAKRMKMKVQFIRMPRQHISSALRNGRGDIAAAKLDTGTIADLCFLPVIPYAPAAKGNLAFMVRTDDAEWQKQLASAASALEIGKIVSGNSNTIGSVRFKVADDTDKTPPAMKKTEPVKVSIQPQKQPDKMKKNIPIKKTDNTKKTVQIKKTVPAADKTKSLKQEKNKK